MTTIIVLFILTCACWVLATACQRAENYLLNLADFTEPTATPAEISKLHFKALAFFVGRCVLQVMAVWSLIWLTISGVEYAG